MFTQQKHGYTSNCSYAKEIYLKVNYSLKILPIYIQYSCLGLATRSRGQKGSARWSYVAWKAGGLAETWRRGEECFSAWISVLVDLEEMREREIHGEATNGSHYLDLYFDFVLPSQTHLALSPQFMPWNATNWWPDFGPQWSCFKLAFTYQGLGNFGHFIKNILYMH